MKFSSIHDFVFFMALVGICAVVVLNLSAFIMYKISKKISTEAVIISKQSTVMFDDNGSPYPVYSLTFQLKNGDRFSYYVSAGEYTLYQEGDVGILETKDSALLKFTPCPHN